MYTKGVRFTHFSGIRIKSPANIKEICMYLILVYIKR